MAAATHRTNADGVFGQITFLQPGLVLHTLTLCQSLHQLMAGVDLQLRLIGRTPLTNLGKPLTGE